MKYSKIAIITINWKKNCCLKYPNIIYFIAIGQINEDFGKKMKAIEYSIVICVLEHRKFHCHLLIEIFLMMMNFSIEDNIWLKYMTAHPSIK